MKAPEKSKNKKDKVKKKSGMNKTQPKKEQVLVVAQEIKYARWLSGNDKKTRDRVLKALKKWLTNCFEKNYKFKTEDFTRVWKGLFYAVWMSDKPLVQEELCESISSILDLFPPDQLVNALLMTKAGFKMLATEWYGIDQHRIDKFLMLVRRYQRGSLRVLKRCDWSLDSCQKYAKMLSGSDGLLAVQTPHYARNASSMLTHFTECFLEELAKVSSGQLPAASVPALVRPFAEHAGRGGSPALAAACRRLLTDLLRHSAEGLDYRDRTTAWKQMGCPEGGPEALELESDDEQDQEVNGDVHSDDEMDDGRAPLDPRAGRVDVWLPPLPAAAPALARMLRALLPSAPCKAQRRLRICLDRFETLARGQYPLPVEVPPPLPGTNTSAKQAARELCSLEHQLRADADELKLRGLSRKHRKRLLKKSRAGLSIVEDVDSINESLSKESNNGEWLVEPAEAKKEETSNKENQNKNKKSKQNGNKRSSTEPQDDGNTKKLRLDKDKNNIVKNTSKKDTFKREDKSKTNVKSADSKVMSKADESKKDNKIAPKDQEHKSKKEVKQSKHHPQIIPDKSDKTIPGNTDKTKPDTKNYKIREKSKIEIKDKKKVLTKETKKTEVKTNKKTLEKPTFIANKVKKFQKHKEKEVTKKPLYETPKKVKFELKNNSMQKPVDYYKSVRQSPNIPFDSSKQPSKTNLKPSTPSPINPFFKKKLRMKK